MQAPPPLLLTHCPDQLQLALPVVELVILSGALVPSDPGPLDHHLSALDSGGSDSEQDV